LPPELAAFKLNIGDDGKALVYDYDTRADRTGVATLLGELSRAGIRIRDLQTTQSSLEDIFVGLVSGRK
jgi:ABC-2 type transport system ATP-binding protein